MSGSECQWNTKGKLQLTGVDNDNLWLISKTSNWKAAYEQFCDEIFTMGTHSGTIYQPPNDKIRANRLKWMECIIKLITAKGKGEESEFPRLKIAKMKENKAFKQFWYNIENDLATKKDKYEALGKIKMRKNAQAAKSIREKVKKEYDEAVAKEKKWLNYHDINDKQFKTVIAEIAKDKSNAPSAKLEFFDEYNDYEDYQAYDDAYFGDIGNGHNDALRSGYYQHEYHKQLYAPSDNYGYDSNYYGVQSGSNMDGSAMVVASLGVIITLAVFCLCACLIGGGIGYWMRKMMNGQKESGKDKYFRVRGGDNRNDDEEV